MRGLRGHVDAAIGEERIDRRTFCEAILPGGAFKALPQGCANILIEVVVRRLEGPLQKVDLEPFAQSTHQAPLRTRICEHSIDLHLEIRANKGIVIGGLKERFIWHRGPEEIAQTARRLVR